MREEDLRQWRRMTAEKTQVILARARALMGPDDYRLIEAWARLDLYVKERAVKGDVTEEELCEGIRDRLEAIARSRVAT